MYVCIYKGCHILFFFTVHIFITPLEYGWIQSWGGVKTVRGAVERVNRGRERRTERERSSVVSSASSSSSSSSTSSSTWRIDWALWSSSLHCPSSGSAWHKNEIAFHARVATIDTNYRDEGIYAFSSVLLLMLSLATFVKVRILASIRRISTAGLVRVVLYVIVVVFVDSAGNPKLRHALHAFLLFRSCFFKTDVAVPCCGMLVLALIQSSLVGVWILVVKLGWWCCCYA